MVESQLFRVSGGTGGSCNVCAQAPWIWNCGLGNVDWGLTIKMSAGHQMYRIYLPDAYDLFTGFIFRISIQSQIVRVHYDVRSFDSIPLINSGNQFQFSLCTKPMLMTEIPSSHFTLPVCYQYKQGKTNQIMKIILLSLFAFLIG